MSWKITDFTEQIRKAVNDEKLNRKTVSTWFNKLEDDKIHYVNRETETDEKLYDELDLQIGIFIKKKRNKKVPLKHIFTDIPKQFEIRPLPEEAGFNHLNEEVLQALPEFLLDKLDVSSLKKEIIEELKSAYEEVAATQLSHILESYEALIEHLPKQENYEEERERKFQELVLRRRVEYQLEREALLLWMSQPESERLRKVGWFRKEEDTFKRELFVKEYVNSHFAERIKKELFFEKKNEGEIVGEITVLTPALTR